MSEQGRQGILDANTIEVVELSDRLRAHLSARWPCPLCGERRALVDARRARVRNLVGPPLERCILLCQPCLAQIRVPVRDPRTGG